MSDSDSDDEAPRGTQVKAGTVPTANQRHECCSTGLVSSFSTSTSNMDRRCDIEASPVCQAPAETAKLTAPGVDVTFEVAGLQV